MEKIKFTDMFNEGTNIKFTPDDLNKTDSEIENFKKKLMLYNEQHPLIEDFDISNLSYLLNNETFFDLQHYTNSSWLQYFITKYKIEGSKLNDLMQQAIQQEDYNAVKILLNNNYIVSQKDLNTLAKTEKEIKDKVQENKTDGYESYIISNSKINLISNEINKKLYSYKVSDPDGYTNLRKDKNTSSEILQQIKSGESIDVLENQGDWWLVKTSEGKQGYVHKSRVKVN
ncbi:SH3 domain-containing protein [Chryseobacterium polytrichastri]|nr:SH3 domain-containing protein [Chryseobacterium polytrichastri]